MTGTVCDFIRLSGCNMWDGRPETKATSQCPFCDTDFLSHTLMEAGEIIQKLLLLRAGDGTYGKTEWVTISGGEPCLQIDQTLIDELHNAGFKVAVETNGTVPLKADVDYVTLSPKLGPGSTVLTRCDCLKILYPHPNPAVTPTAYDYIDAKERYLQPVAPDGEDRLGENLQATIRKLYNLAGWKLSLQTHKYMGVE